MTRQNSKSLGTHTQPSLPSLGLLLLLLTALSTALWTFSENTNLKLWNFFPIKPSSASLAWREKKVKIVANYDSNACWPEDTVDTACCDQSLKTHFQTLLQRLHKSEKLALTSPFLSIVTWVWNGLVPFWTVNYYSLHFSNFCEVYFFDTVNAHSIVPQPISVRNPKRAGTSPRQEVVHKKSTKNPAHLPTKMKLT